jgi:uncharacterized protein YjiK
MKLAKASVDVESGVKQFQGIGVDGDGVCYVTRVQDLQP